MNRSRTLKLHQLHYLIAVGEHGSLRQAARSQEVSVAAISRGLQDLEDTVGVPLFERQTRGLMLTEAGKSLLCRARNVAGEIEGAFDDMGIFQAKTDTKLSVGITPWIAKSLISPTINRFLSARPDVTLSLHETFGTDYAALRENVIDIAIGLAPETVASDLVCRPLFSYEQAIVCRAGHPMKGARTLESLKEQSWILSYGIEHFKPPLREFYHRCYGPGPTRSPGRIHYTRSSLMVLEIIENSDLLSVMPWPLIEGARNRYRVEAIAIQEALPENTTGFVTRRNTPSNGAIVQFIDSLIATVDDYHKTNNRVLRRIFHSFDTIGK